MRVLPAYVMDDVGTMSDVDQLIRLKILFAALILPPGNWHM